MGKTTITLALCLLLSLYLSASAAAVAVTASASEEDRVNKSSTSGILWATAKDKINFFAATDPDDDYAVDGDASDELAGGFSSLEGMLQWAIGHSDPEKLKDKAGDTQRLSPAELNKRQLEIKELMEKLKMPSDAELMKVAINDLNNSSTSFEDRLRALNELLILVEPIDNANDLNKLGGLVAVVRELDNPEPEIRTISAWILGKACQNNALVQNQDIMSNVSIDIRLQKKAVLLVADLVDYQQESAGGVKHAAVSDRFFLKAVVDLTSSNDLDLQEKALLAIKSLLQLPSTEASDFKNFCDIEKVLQRIKQQLGERKKENDYYDEEITNLLGEIHIIFQRKLDKVSWVPT